MNLRSGLPLIILGLSVIFLSGCLLESDSSRSDHVVAESDQAVYDNEEVVQIQIENRTGRSVLFPRCDTLVYNIERRQNDAWKRFRRIDFCTDNVSQVPITLEVGAKREVKVGKLRLGRYRFVVEYGFEAESAVIGGSESADRRETISNVFRVEDQ